MKNEVEIAIIGDDSLTATMYLSNEELATLEKLRKALKADGPFAPRFWLRNLTQERRERAYAERKRREEFEEAASHVGVYPIGNIFKSAMADAGWTV